MRTQNHGKARQRQGIKTSTRVSIMHPDGTREELIPVWEASKPHSKAVDAPTSELE
ncbi:MAG: hypothetical protein RBT74_10930 [Tenuifilaceae bacterium]|nr:hypothetical protein [Tenuifilaceae bacterium]